MVRGAAVGTGKATQLVINKRLTGGLDRDGRNGDEGILVVVEPRDAQGRLVKAPGALSVVVMDPAQEGEAGRVARWDFAAHEVHSHFHSTVFGRGLQFELPWPGEPPKNSALRLFVRFITEDGQEAERRTSRSKSSRHRHTMPCRSADQELGAHAERRSNRREHPLRA